MKPLFQLLLLAVLLTALASCSEALSIHRGTAAPAFELPDLDGTVHELASYEGQKVYLYFWASWCSICLAGMSELDELAESGEEFTVLTIVSPGAHAEKNTEAFKRWFDTFRQSDDIIVLIDEGGQVYEHYQIDGYPSSVFISSNGQLAEQYTGHIPNSEILELMNSIH